VPPGDPLARLDGDRRSRDLDHLLRHEVDVLVVGGGITGAGVALDAASRGLSVALVERHDLAHGTSRWSSKLIHGGLRYLAKGDLPIAWESAAERAVIGRTIAPHLVRPLTQVLPYREGETANAVTARAAYLAGDVLRVAARTRAGQLARSRRVGPREALELAPALDPDGLAGAVVGMDLQLSDDARMVVAVARTAAAYGARILTRAEATAIGPGGVRVLDRRTGRDHLLRARAVVNACGVWAAGLDPRVDLAPSRGTHLVLRSHVLQGQPVSLQVPVPGKFGRVVFTLPQVHDGLTYVGLTDEPAPGPVPHVAAVPRADVDWLLQVLSGRLAVPLTRADVVGSFAGLRPLLAGDGQSADLSRRHAIVGDGRLLTVTGGKFTAYRRMAQDVVDRLTDRPCRTRAVPLVGAAPGQRDPAVPARLWARYGAEAPLVWSLGRADPMLHRPVADGLGVLGAEFAFGVLHEGAATVEDLLDRRTRVGLVPADRERALPAAEVILDRYRRAEAPVDR
jgi:glycerol-3-phosphate dehydrogenase